MSTKGLVRMQNDLLWQSGGYYILQTLVFIAFTKLKYFEYPNQKLVVFFLFPFPCSVICCFKLRLNSVHQSLVSNCPSSIYSLNIWFPYTVYANLTGFVSNQGPLLLQTHQQAQIDTTLKKKCRLRLT